MELREEGYTNVETTGEHEWRGGTREYGKEEMKIWAEG